MFFAFSNINPESHNKIIEAELISIDSITQILSDQGIEFERDEHTIQVVRGLAFDVFISLEEDKSLIKLRTYVKLNDDVTPKQLKDLVLELNHETGPLKFTGTYYKDQTPPHGYIDGDYYVQYQFGLTPEEILYLIRFFSLAFSNAIKSVNKNKKIADVLFQG